MKPIAIFHTLLLVYLLSTNSFSQKIEIKDNQPYFSILKVDNSSHSTVSIRKSHQNKYKGVGLHVPLLSFGKLHHYNGIRISISDKNVKVVNGINIGLLRAKAKQNNGLSIGNFLNLDSIQNGFSCGIINFGAKKNGIATGIMIAGAKTMNGVALGGLIVAGDTLNGTAMGAIQLISKINGMGVSYLQCSDTLNGVFVSFMTGEPSSSSKKNELKNSQLKGVIVSVACNIIDKVEGVTISICNYSKQHHGLSFGLVNRTKKLKGLQFGLLNYAGNNPRALRYLPILNMHLGK